MYILNSSVSLLSVIQVLFLRTFSFISFPFLMFGC